MHQYINPSNLTLLEIYHMKNFFFGLLVFASVNLVAQTTIETKIIVTANAGTNGGAFDVAIQAKGTNLTANNTIGSITLDVNYTAAHIAPIILGGTVVSGIYEATIGGNYSRSLNNVPGGPYVRLAVSGSSINQNFDGTPAGFDLTSSYQTLATIHFTISNNLVATNLSIATGSLTVGLFDSHNNSNTSGTILAQTMSAPVNITAVALPVELTSFTATPSRCGVDLNWKTATETNNAGFDVERASSGSTQTPGLWTKVGYVDGAGTSNAPKEYSYTDKLTKSGKYFYRLKQIDQNGAFKYSPEVSGTMEVPYVFTMSQNYPNPFNPTTVINYSIASASNVALKVYDMLGSEVAVLVNGQLSPGNYTATLDASRLSSGVYFYRLVAGSFSDVKRLTIMK